MHRLSHLNIDHQLRMAKMLPVRVILRVVDKKIVGVVKNATSKSESESAVYIFVSDSEQRMQGGLTLDAVADANFNHNPKNRTEFLFDPLDLDSPIDVDWSKWLDATTKYDKSNAHFTPKLHGTYMLRAQVAENELDLLRPVYDKMSNTIQGLETKLERIQRVITEDDA
jgi:hypothetical protein